MIRLLFYCHKQIGIELARHNIAGSPEWFEEKVAEQSGFTREDAEPYIKSYMNGCLGKNQKIFKVQDASKEKRVCKVPCEQVFDEMFNGKIEEMKNGNLKYI